MRTFFMFCVLLFAFMALCVGSASMSHTILMIASFSAWNSPDGWLNLTAGSGVIALGMIIALLALIHDAQMTPPKPKDEDE